MTTVVSNLSTEIDFQLQQGADFATVITVLTANGSPQDLTGATVSAAIKRTGATSMVSASFTATLSGTPTDGKVTLSLTAAQNVLGAGVSISDPNGQYVWDLKVVLSGGANLRPFFGKVSVVQDVTP